MKWVIEEQSHSDELYVREGGRVVLAVLSPHKSGVQTDEHREIMRQTAEEIVEAHNSKE